MFSTPSTSQQPKPLQQTPINTAEATPRPYQTRERLYYETDYIKSDTGDNSGFAGGKPTMFEPFMKQSRPEAAGTAAADLPPTTSLHEFMFSPAKGGETASTANTPNPSAALDVSTAKCGMTGSMPITKAITVFGFPPSCRSEIVSAFASFGPIEQYDFGESNWLHIIYESEWSAQKALARNGSIFNPGGMMIGVVPMQAALEQVSAAADSFMSPIKGELDRTRPVTDSIFRKPVKNVDKERLATLPDDSSIMTKAVNYLLNW